MQQNELKKLLAEIAAVDNRKLTTEALEAWGRIIGHLSYEVASEALLKARKDPSIQYLEPRHIIDWSKQILAYRRMPVELPEFKGHPEPECKHSIPVTQCKPCCKELAAFADRNNLLGKDHKVQYKDPALEEARINRIIKERDMIHTYAKQNIYA